MTINLKNVSPSNTLGENAVVFGADSMNGNVAVYTASAISKNSVNDVATLRTIPVTEGRSIELLGYYTAGDGGGSTVYGVGPITATGSTNTGFKLVYVNTTGLGIVVNSAISINGVSVGTITSVSASVIQFTGTWTGGYVGSANVSIIPPDDGGMAFSAPGGQWVRPIPDTGRISALYFGAKRVTSTTNPDDDSSAAVTAAAAWIGSTSTLNPREVYLPKGLYRFSTSPTFPSGIGLVGDGGNAASPSANGTTIHWYGQGWCLDFVYPSKISDFSIYGKGTNQCGVRFIGTQTVMENVQIWDIDRIGLSNSKTSVNASFFCDIKNVSVVNQGSVYGQCAIYNSGYGYGNSNSNTYTNVFAKGYWKTVYEIAGNGNVFIAGDCEPYGSTISSPDFGKYWYFIRGNTNKVIDPYIEPNTSYGAVGTMSDEFRYRYRPITFTSYTKLIEFLAAPTAGDTISINGTTITFVSSGAVGNQCNIPATTGLAGIADTVINLAAVVNGSSDVNLSKLNADERFTDIIFSTRSTDAPGSIICTSANNAFRNPTGVSQNQWGVSSGNEFDKTNWTISAGYGSTSGCIRDLGVSNNVKASRIFWFSAQPAGQKVSTRNLAPNSELRNMKSSVDSFGFLMPTGYNVNTASGGVTVQRVTTPTPNGSPYSLQCDVATGGRLDLEFSPVHNISSSRPPQPIPVDALKNKTVIVGWWVKSSVPGLGTVGLYDGYSWGGTSSHSGSGEWEFLTACARIANSNVNQVKLYLGNALGTTQTPVLSRVAKSGNTGNGTMSAPTAQTGLVSGTYNVVFTSATDFNVFDPSGSNIGSGTVGIAFATQVGFTITAGTIAFVSGDTFYIKVTETGGTFYASQPVFMFGNVIPDAPQPLLLDDVDAASFGRITLNPPQTLEELTTPNVAQFNLFTEQYASPVNVSKFLGGRSGQEITIFTTTTNVTFVNTAAATADTIYMKGGANVTAAANRVYKFLFNGTKWYEV